jgi:hypothetical protein
MSRVRTQQTEIREFKLASYNSAERRQLSLMSGQGRILASITLEKHSIPGWTIQTARVLGKDFPEFAHRIFGDDVEDKETQEIFFRELLTAWRDKQLRTWELLSGCMNGTEKFLNELRIRIIFPSGKSFKIKFKPERKRG